MYATLLQLCLQNLFCDVENHGFVFRYAFILTFVIIRQRHGVRLTDPAPQVRFTGGADCIRRIFQAAE